MGMMKSEFGRIVIEAMEAKGWSMARLHRESGVSYDVIAKLKQRPNSSTTAGNARALAKALELTAVDVVIPGKNPVADEIHELIETADPDEQLMIRAVIKAVLDRRHEAE